LIKEDDPAKDFIIILKGGGTESSVNKDSKFKTCKKTIGNFVSVHNLIGFNGKYETSFVADTSMTAHFMPIEKIVKFMYANEDLLAYVWRESLKSLIKLYTQDFKLLSELSTEEIDTLIGYTVFRNAPATTIVELRNGGILLKGTLKEYS